MAWCHTQKHYETFVEPSNQTSRKVWHEGSTNVDADQISHMKPDQDQQLCRTSELVTSYKFAEESGVGLIA